MDKISREREGVWDWDWGSEREKVSRAVSRSSRGLERYFGASTHFTGDCVVPTNRLWLIVGVMISDLSQN
jgi:hypothetical protein